jgi:hypothetical protein
MSELITNGYRNKKLYEDKTVASSPDGITTSLTEASRSGIERDCLAAIGDCLERHYPHPKGVPGWWGVQIAGSCINIWNTLLSGHWGYVIHSANLSPEKVVRAGGEILERFGVPRDYRKYSADQLVQMHEKSPLGLKPHA